MERIEAALQDNQTSSETGFADLGLSDRVLDCVNAVGYTNPSPIQKAFIPLAVRGGDCIGQARTGTGKTASFALPIIEQLDIENKTPQALILAPTRELSEQVAVETRKLAPKGVNVAVFVGGKPIGPQANQIKRGVHIAIGTPGRVIDLLSRGILSFSNLKMVVLDEADRMLDIGFRPDIEKILKQCPSSRQTLLLSATLPPPVERLALRFMKDPERIDLSEDGVAVDTIEQFYATVDVNRKFGLLVRVLAKEKPQQVLIFTRTKRGTEQLHRRFSKRLRNVAMMNGNLAQAKRDRVMKQFREGKVRVLIATDVVGRGIDISGISHIINYDIPEFCDDYVHRVGRTGRLSSAEKGRAITFVTKEQGDQLTNIEMRINTLLPEYKIDDYESFQPKQRREHRQKASVS